ncbi:hypothetical protein LR48_Vigan07g197900 [Vigna angularis]|uniref:Uncharacterized protein n=1 Tax=Phaseolus angularis TaxID=3914 RepID=A0A0L9UZH7_PHAAN|nr:hypothetical protein LR48_Vigan07g197900 [Vigna angularis]
MLLTRFPRNRCLKEPTNSVLSRTDAYVSASDLPPTCQTRLSMLLTRFVEDRCCFLVLAGVYAPVGFLTEMNHLRSSSSQRELQKPASYKPWLPSPFASIAFAPIVGDRRLSSSSPPIRVVTTFKCFGVSSALLPSPSRLSFGWLLRLPLLPSPSSVLPFQSRLSVSPSLLPRSQGLDPKSISIFIACV